MNKSQFLNFYFFYTIKIDMMQQHMDEANATVEQRLFEEIS